MARNSPAATDLPEEHADWLELTALKARDGNTSMEDLLALFRLSGTDEELPDSRAAGRRDSSEIVGEAAFEELRLRQRACGGRRYPFQVTSSIIQSRRTTQRALYTFLLLLSAYGKDAGPRHSDPVAMFDEIAALAGQQYLGGSKAGVEYYLFGFPRRINPTGFADAVTDLCQRLQEAAPSGKAPETEDEKDAKLDVVIWRPFRDGRQGKLIALGQCATGADWRDKLSELQPRDFGALALSEQPAVEPIRMFFTPARLDGKKWRKWTIRGGVVFDRCRISDLATDLPTRLSNRIATWNTHVLGSRVMA